MDTSIAIGILEGVLNTEQNTATGSQAKADAIVLALDQLKGILVTQAIQLDQKYKDEIIDLNKTIINVNNEKNVLSQKVIDLQAQLDALIPPGDVINP